MRLLLRLLRSLRRFVPQRYSGGRLDHLDEDAQREVLAQHVRNGF